MQGRKLLSMRDFGQIDQKDGPFVWDGRPVSSAWLIHPSQHLLYKQQKHIVIYYAQQKHSNCSLRWCLANCKNCRKNSVRDVNWMETGTTADFFVYAFWRVAANYHSVWASQALKQIKENTNAKKDPAEWIGPCGKRRLFSKVCKLFVLRNY